MRFISEGTDAASNAIAEAISNNLQNKQRVLWFVSGGSNIAIEVQIMKQLQDTYPELLDGLAILPMDERYGESGHADSNVAGLRKAGFESGTATFVDVLMHNVNFEQTVDFYGEVTSTALAYADYVIGQFGLGTDGHVAGLLPRSPALNPSESVISGYEWTDYPRMTLTTGTLKHFSTSYVLAYGDSKRQALERLRDNTESLEDLPAKILYELPDVYIYNDQLESEA